MIQIEMSVSEFDVYGQCFDVISAGVDVVHLLTPTDQGLSTSAADKI